MFGIFSQRAQDKIIKIENVLYKIHKVQKMDMNSSIDISCKFVRYLLLRVLKMLKLHQAFWEILSFAFSPFQDSTVMTRGPTVCQSC